MKKKYLYAHPESSAEEKSGILPVQAITGRLPSICSTPVFANVCRKQSLRFQYVFLFE